jgi:hypothetical protein
MAFKQYMEYEKYYGTISSNRRMHESQQAYSADSPNTSSTPSPIICPQAHRHSNGHHHASNQSNSNSSSNIRNGSNTNNVDNPNGTNNTAYDSLITNGTTRFDHNTRMEQFGYSVVPIVSNNANNNNNNNNMSQGSACMHAIHHLE